MSCKIVTAELTRTSLSLLCSAVLESHFLGSDGACPSQGHGKDTGVLRLF